MAAADNDFRVYSYRWVVLIAFMLINLVIQIQWLTHAPVARAAAVFYAGQFNPASLFNIDFLALIYMLAFLVVSFPASYIIDTWGIRVGIGIGAVLAAAAGLAKGIFADSFTAVVISQCVFAIAQPFVLNAVTALTARWFPLSERGTAAGLAALAQYLGIILVMLVTPLLVVSSPADPGYGSGFGSMLMIYGIATVVAAVIALIVIRERPPTPPSSESAVRHGFTKGLRHILSLRDMRMMIVLFFIGLGVFNAVSSMVDAIAANLRVLDSDGFIGGSMLIGGVIGAVILPILSDKYQKRKLFMVVCIAGMVPGLAMLSFASWLTGGPGVNPESAYVVAIAGSFILGFFIMSAGPIGFQYAAEVSAPASESTSQGLLLLAGQITGLLFVVGMSLRENRYLPAFLIGFVVLSVVALIAVSTVRESPAMRTSAATRTLG